MKTIFLMMIGMSMLNAELIKTGDIVVDNISNLEWQDDTNSSAANWQDALDRCVNLTLDTKTDWRLPNVNELKSTLDRSRISPATNSAFTYISTPSFYWSSTTDANLSTLAWGMSASLGVVGKASKSLPAASVRCVRTK